MNKLFILLWLLAFILSEVNVNLSLLLGILVLIIAYKQNIFEF